MKRFDGYISLMADFTALMKVIQLFLFENSLYHLYCELCLSTPKNRTLGLLISTYHLLNTDTAVCNF
jgi:hypothetical protein